MAERCVGCVYVCVAARYVGVCVTERCVWLKCWCVGMWLKGVLWCVCWDLWLKGVWEGGTCS